MSIWTVVSSALARGWLIALQVSFIFRSWRPSGPNVMSLFTPLLFGISYVSLITGTSSLYQCMTGVGFPRREREREKVDISTSTQRLKRNVQHCTVRRSIINDWCVKLRWRKRETQKENTPKARCLLWHNMKVISAVKQIRFHYTPKMPMFYTKQFSSLQHSLIWPEPKQREKGKNGSIHKK